MKRSLAFTFILIQVLHFGTSLTRKQEWLIDDFIENEIRPRNNIPGLGLSIVENGKTTFYKGYGQRDIRNVLFVDGKTVFAIGSITKSMTAVLVVKILNEKFPGLGEKVLDRPITELAPNYEFKFNDRSRSESMTFRDLLAHKTCMDTGYISYTFYPFQSTDEFMYRTRYNKEKCPFRSQFVYNNAMYVLAGELIASIAQTTIQNLFINFFQDLNMRDSEFIDVNGYFLTHPNLSRGYIMKEGQTVDFNMNLLRNADLSLAGHGVLSSPQDMARYMKFHLNKGSYKDKQIVPSNVMSWLYKPSIHIDFQSYQTTNNKFVSGTYAYGLGFFLNIFDGWQLNQHLGYCPPFLSHLTLVPGQQLGIFTASNGPGLINSPFDHMRLHAYIFDVINSQESKLKSSQRRLGRFDDSESSKEEAYNENHIESQEDVSNDNSKFDEVSNESYKHDEETSYESYEEESNVSDQSKEEISDESDEEEFNISHASDEEIDNESSNVSNEDENGNFQSYTDASNTSSNFEQTSNEIYISDEENSEEIYNSSLLASTNDLRQNCRNDDLESLIGVYGNPLQGSISISSSRSDELEFQFGKWGLGRLFCIENTDSRYLFAINWTTDVQQHDYANNPGKPIPQYYADFVGAHYKTLVFANNQGLRVTFVKDRILSTYPSIPWSAGTCSPYRPIY